MMIIRNRVMGQQGFTLVEQLVTVAIMAMVFTAAIAALSTGALGLNVTQSRNTAMNFAQLQMECVKHARFDDVSPGTYAYCGPDDDDKVPADLGYTVNTEILGTNDFPPELSGFTGSDVLLVRVTVMRGDLNILELEDLKVNRETNSN